MMPILTDGAMLKRAILSEDVGGRKLEASAK
jgi:hypothetical protein